MQVINFIKDFVFFGGGGLCLSSAQSATLCKNALEEMPLSSFLCNKSLSTAQGHGLLFNEAGVRTVMSLEGWEDEAVRTEVVARLVPATEN